MKIKEFSRVEIYLISFIAVLILFILLTWKNYTARIKVGLENYRAKFEQVDTIKK